mmetsp:Transcript_90185/g.263731  ORF Transcript_90185/g.263731 Transcript_90185/m.263731 type:complete len:318 (-) Transcript_90185:72-1025(-)
MALGVSADQMFAWGAPGFLEPDPGAEPDWEPTPEDVVAALEMAYEGRQVWIGEPLGATPTEDAQACAAGTCLTYGEVHQDGLTKLLGPRGLDLSGRKCRCLLELGSGRGRLALQAFLQFPALRRVLGVELVGSRHRAAAGAARRLQEGFPGRFRLEVDSGEPAPEVDSGEPAPEVTGADGDCGKEREVRVLEGEGESLRSCEIRMADLAELPDEDLRSADAILLEVVMPPGPCVGAAHSRLCSRLAALCQHGCVLAAYEDLHSLWRALPQGAPECPFHKLELCDGGFATSWSPVGHHFHGFLCDRERPPSVAPGTWL